MKAFDTINHLIMIQKLAAYGETSEQKSITVGVPWDLSFDSCCSLYM